MTDNPISNAVAVRDNSPQGLIEQYRGDFTTVLPSHVKSGTWVRLAQGVLRRDKNLAQVAQRNPGSFMSALLECARLGHEPGTEAFYLVPFGNEVQGIEGYRGVVERIYRAGAVKSVQAEVVCENDTFIWTPGKVDRHEPPRWDGPQAVPFHDIDWFGDRGKVKGAYAYAIFQDGTPSKVVVINQVYIDKVRKESRGSDKASSPWVKWYEQMVLKTVARRLEPWVPTSTEWRKEQMRAAQQVAAEGHVTQLPAGPPPPVSDPDEVVEGELMDDDTAA
ncbi:recombinase RecT [Streptomyces sparsogenes]|uniref:recombinase RecT n=1 Tax=Streptomyces sparsogenes TaxID=67365 RepID=UPI0033CE8206